MAFWVSQTLIPLDMRLTIRFCDLQGGGFAGMGGVQYEVRALLPDENRQR